MTEQDGIQNGIQDRIQDRIQNRTEVADSPRARDGQVVPTDGALSAKSSEQAEGTPPAEVRVSVQILLPDSTDRRFERWADKVPGASWPGWGGHITLVPPFVPTVPPEEVYQRLQTVCQKLSPFRVRLAEPVAVQDATRPDYKAVFLAVAQDKDLDHNYLFAAYTAVNAAVADMTHGTHAGLAEQPFLPHITLALSIGEMEAARMVKNMKADPIQAKFRVDELSLVLMITQGTDRRVEKRSLPLGPPKPVGLLSD